MSLSDKEVDQLFKMRKHPIDRVSVNFPLHRDKVTIELEGSTRIFFKADINRAVRKDKKGKATYQLRHRDTIKIRRMDLKGNHTNPEGPAPLPEFIGYESHEFLEEDHVHFHINGYDSRWALPLTEIEELGISDIDTMLEKLRKFLEYCNVINLEIDNNPTLFSTFE